LAFIIDMPRGRVPHSRSDILNEKGGSQVSRYSPRLDDRLKAIYKDGKQERDSDKPDGNRNHVICPYTVANESRYSEEPW
jgi:hypothetical protein